MPDRQQLVRAFGAPSYTSAQDGPRAAVAAVFRDGDDGIEALFIERAKHPQDPWSGQMAFPGGRCEPEDATSEVTARRETVEELGLDLSVAVHLGQIDDLDSDRRRITVSPHGYWLDGGRPALTPNYEVAATVWVSLRHLADEANVIDYEYPPLAGQLFPGIAIAGDRVIWGLTLRLLFGLHQRLESPFPTRLDQS